MRKTTIATLLALVVLGGGGYLFLANPFDADGSKVEELSRKWMEDLQFKDFRSSSLYHHKLDRKRVDIGRALERLFVVKPELLDIMDYHLVDTEIDSTDQRARVRVKVRYKKLNKDKEPQEADLMLYWMKRHPDCPVGGSCSAGTCVDERGETLYKPDESGQDVDHGSPQDAPEPAETTDETYSCDTSADPRWFMNLDSTLKEKEYQRE